MSGRRGDGLRGVPVLLLLFALATCYSALLFGQPFCRVQCTPITSPRIAPSLLDELLQKAAVSASVLIWDVGPGLAPARPPQVAALLSKAGNYPVPTDHELPSASAGAMTVPRVHGAQAAWTGGAGGTLPLGNYEPEGATEYDSNSSGAMAVSFTTQRAGAKSAAILAAPKSKLAYHANPLENSASAPATRGFMNAFSHQTCALIPQDVMVETDRSNFVLAGVWAAIRGVAERVPGYASLSAGSFVPVPTQRSRLIPGRTRTEDAPFHKEQSAAPP